MKLKNIICLSALVGSMMFCSCENVSIDDFVADFCNAIEANDKAAIEKAYPDATKFEMDTFAVDLSKVAVEPVEGTDGYRASICEGRELMVEKTSDGKFQITSSRGLLYIPADKKELAKLSGWIDPKLTDGENAVRLADEGFERYLAKKLNGFLKDKVKIFGVEYEEISSKETDWFDEEKTDPMIWDYSERINIIIENDLDVDIDASAYVCTKVLYIWDYMAPRPEKPSVVPSQKIKAHSKAELISFYDGSYECVEGTGEIEHVDASLSFNFDKIDIESVYEFTGEEYSDYLSSKDDADDSDPTLCILNGTIGVDENASMTIDGANGSYTFLRDVRTLSLDKYDATTNELVLNAFADNSLIGQFKGKLTGKEGGRRYKGIFTNKKNGAKIDFDLKELQ